MDLVASCPVSALVATLLMWVCRSGTGPNDTVLALGVDDSVLAASRMSRQLVEDSARSCDGVILQVHSLGCLHSAAVVGGPMYGVLHTNRAYLPTCTDRIDTACDNRYRKE